MNMSFEMLLASLDGLHIGLAATVLVLLLLLVFKNKPNKLDAGDISQKKLEEAESTDSSPTEIKPTGQFAALAPDSALQLLSLLQQEARLIDFLQEDAQQFSDAEVGAAARVVHAGARKVLLENFVLAPLRSENEGAQVTLAPGFNNHEIRLSGQVVGEPPFKGQLLHRGWRVVSSNLPKVAEGHDLTVIAPAELEI